MAQSRSGQRNEEIRSLDKQIDQVHQEIVSLTSKALTNGAPLSVLDRNRKKSLEEKLRKLKLQRKQLLEPGGDQLTRRTNRVSLQEHFEMVEKHKRMFPLINSFVFRVIIRYMTHGRADA